MQKDNRKSRSPYQIAALNLKDGFTRAKKKFSDLAPEATVLLTLT
jgi:hypothetical protein